MSSRWKWNGESAGAELRRYRLKRGDVTVALVERCADGWFIRSADGRLNTSTQQPPRTWPDPEGARKAARDWAQAQEAKRGEVWT